MGNSPEFMALDNSLNADIKWSRDKYVALTRHLPKDDWRKFCNRTPKSISRGIKRLIDTEDTVCPTSQRIVQDCDKALELMWIVYKADGAIVPGLANHNG